MFSARMRQADQTALAALSSRTGLTGQTDLFRHLLHRQVSLPSEVLGLLRRLLDEWRPTQLRDAKLKALAIDTLAGVA
jgi:hypothetical protein